VGPTVVNYDQSNTGITADLKAGTVTYGLRSINGNPIKVLPLGDSITQGVMVSDLGGYRDDLWALLNDNSYSVDFVGDRSSGEGDFDSDHAGVPGERIDQVADRVNDLLSIYQPDAILLMIGTNDNLQDFNLADAPNRLNNLISQITSQAPGRHLFVASIPPDKNFSRQQRLVEYNTQIQGIADSYANVTFVDIGKQLSWYDLEDSVHPTPEGNNKIAQAWYDAIRNVYGVSGTTTVYTDTLTGIENVIGTDYDDILIGIVSITYSSAGRATMS
jgi:lysophospholipase L1-like esterase